MPKKKKGGGLRDRAKAFKERAKEKPGMQKAKEVIAKVKAARASGEKASDVKGGKMRKKGTKMFLKSGGKGNPNC